MDDIKTAAFKWGQEIGREEAISRLIMTKKVSVSTAEQLVDGRYTGEPRKKLTETLKAEFRKDGFAFSQKAKAS